MRSLETHKKRYTLARRKDVRAVRDLERLIAELQAPADTEETRASLPEIRWQDRPELEYSMALEQEVNNAARTWNFPRRFTYLRPWSLRGLVQAVLFAEARNMQVKAIGGRWSFSRVVEAGDCYIDMRIAHPYRLDRHNDTARSVDQSALDRLKPALNRDRFFDCPAGMTIEEANYLLCPYKKTDRAFFGRRRLYNLGGADLQQFAGAFSTGTHGSGGKFSALHDMVRSILLVGGRGNIYRVEPTDGVTDPVLHEIRYRNVPAIDRVQLIQDDDRFYALLVSMGCFGVIHSVLLEVAPMVLLHRDARYHKSRWNDHTRAAIRNYQLPEDPEEEVMRSLLFNPYRVGRRKYQSFLVKTHRPTDREPTAKRERNKKFWPTVFSNLNLTAQLMRALLNDGDLPKRRLIEAALSSQDDPSAGPGRGYTNLSYRVLQAGAGKLNVVGTGIEFAFPREKVVEALDLVFAHLEQQGERGRGYYVNGPIALRFVRPSKAFLAPNYFRYGQAEIDLWCYIEITRVNSKEPEDDVRERELFHHLQEMLINLGGRPHWGLNFDLPFTEARVRAWYPEFDKWKDAFLFFNPSGTFDNTFTGQMGLRAQA